MGSFTDDQYCYERDVKRAEKAYFKQLEEEQVPSIVAASMILSVIRRSGKHTVAEICEALDKEVTKYRVSKRLVAKYLAFQNLLGNIALVEKGVYEQLDYQKPWYGWNIQE